MKKVEAEVKFQCYSCGTESSAIILIDANRDVGAFNMMQKRAFDVECKNPKCGKTNSVEIIC